MHTAASGNFTTTPSAQVFVSQEDLVLYAALIGRKPMSKSLRESISEEPVMMTPVAAPPQPAANHTRERISVWIAHVSAAAKRRLHEARSRLSI
jgi:hypothetical protein